MTREERKLERFKRGAEAMGKEERLALRKAMRAAIELTREEERSRMLRLLTNLGAAGGRDMDKAESDARTDAARRCLVGPRLSREEAQRCRRCAEGLGVSLYRFAADALERECERVERMLSAASDTGTGTE